MAQEANRRADETHLKSTQKGAEDVTEDQSSAQEGTPDEHQATANVSSEEGPVSRAD